MQGTAYNPEVDLATEPRAGADALWQAVDRLVDRAPSLTDLRSHKLELFAVRRWRALGRFIPAELLERERNAAIGALAAPLLLDRVRTAYDGELMLFKGPVVAARYPDPALRSFSDVDLLATNPAEAQTALRAAGFVEVGNPAAYVDIHHLRPLCWPGLPLVVEIHSRPKWPDGIQPPPSVQELFAAVAPAEDRLKRLPEAHHVLLLAAHSWAHEPLRRLRDMIDIAVMAEAANRADVSNLARDWRIERLWRSTIDAVDAVLDGEQRSWTLRLWAHNLEKTRERTVLETHLQRWLSDFAIMPPGAAAARLPRTLARELLPTESERWGTKLSRTARAVRNASRRRSEHNDELDDQRRA